MSDTLQAVIWLLVAALNVASIVITIRASRRM